MAVVVGVCACVRARVVVWVQAHREGVLWGDHSPLGVDGKQLSKRALRLLHRLVELHGWGAGGELVV